MSDPKLLETIDGWEIRQWDYPGAKPIAGRDGGAITVQVSEGGQPVTLDIESDDDRRYTYIPLAVIRRLLRDEPTSAIGSASPPQPDTAPRDPEDGSG